MKLFIILSVIACSYAAKLDRTYLPPASAATAGGSPGSLNTPVGPSGPSGPQFGLPNNGAFGKTAGALNQAGTAPSPQYGQPVGPSFDAGFGQPSQNFGQTQNYQRNQPERAQASSDQKSEILRLDNQNDGETYSYNFETSNGIAVEESGVATNGVQAQGAFSYSDDDGQMFRIAYTADENGFQPQGDHLPTPHPIPDEILKSIEQNARAAAAGTQEGAYNPEEDNESFGPQQYSNNAPTSYNQGPAGPSGSFNQPQVKSPSQLYGAPNAASPSQGFQGSALRPQGPSQLYGGPDGASSGSQGFQDPSQQYNAPNTPTRPQLSQQYGAPNDASSSQGFQGPSQQYNAPNTPAKPQLAQQYGSSNDASRSQGFPSPSQQYGAPNAGPTRPSFNQPQAKSPSALYGAPSNGAIGNQYQGSSNGASNGFAASASAPRPSAFGPSAQSIAQQYQTQSQSQGQFSRPQFSAQAQDDSGYQYNRPQSSAFGRDNGPSVQQYRPQNGAGPSGSQGAFPKSNGAAPQGSFAPASRTNSYGAASSPKAPGPKGNFGSAAQGSFASPSGSVSQFAPVNRPSFGAPNQSPSQKSSESGYEYNQPASQSFGPSRGSQAGFPSASQGQNFKGPQQAPSFTEEEGYKY